MSSKNNILSRKEIYNDINKTYDNIQKELRYIVMKIIKLIRISGNTEKIQVILKNMLDTINID